MCWKLTIIISIAIFAGCNSVNSKSNEVSIQSNQTNNNSEKKEVGFLSEPIEYPFNKVPEDLKPIWDEFIKNGQYRLAQPSDMTFSEQTKSKLPENIRPYEYIWGDLGFEKRVEDKYLAAIVVDTTKTNANKFGLVIFSPLKGSKDKYEINWLYRDKDLSKTNVSRASGEFYVIEYTDDGSQKSCSVKWNKKAKNFECQ